METAEEDPLTAGTTSLLEPLTGPSGIPSQKHLDSDSYSSFRGKEELKMA